MMERIITNTPLANAGSPMLSRNDKRHFFRMMVNANVQILINDPESGREITGICRDLSATGMAVEIDEPLEMGSMLHLRLESTNSSIDSLDAHAKVIRCSQEGEDLYQIGVLFIELN
jgi:c-di-GMP-binding flagellar brake protein YcgR